MASRAIHFGPSGRLSDVFVTSSKVATRFPEGDATSIRKVILRATAVGRMRGSPPAFALTSCCFCGILFSAVSLLSAMIYPIDPSTMG